MPVAQISAAAALRVSKQRFSAIFNATFQCVGLMIKEGMLLEPDDSALGFAGIDPGDAIGRPFLEAHGCADDEDCVR